ncbi:GNAT family N-acetyltransferase [uncultured Treponema sp.]|uniref:GNAT family N-acetyltransferase n=1 Tax=uncultured Treponema sp. TaxID=162155 RepID=UPI0025D6E8CD|nr:GNAT family N-acetyltransferase [uncultured Treponema sp.]
MLIFELIDCDGPGFMQVRNQVFDYLLANEHKCVSLVAHFIKKDTKILYILDERNSIWGVLSISSGGQILHCLESDVVLPVIEEYFGAVKPQKLHSIIGEQKYSDAIAKIFLQKFGTVPKISIDYALMEYNAASAEAAELARKIDSKRKAFLSECEIFDCKDSDFDAMFPIHKAYELEEVVTDKRQYNEQASRIMLRRSIQSGEVFGVRYNNKIVSKASINAKGENCIQLGGIFTDTTLRNRGIASFLVKTLTQRFKKQDKIIVLFVKKANAIALKVYENCGFNSFADYKILYY